MSDFLFGWSPCDFHALEDLGPSEISSGELAILNTCFVSALSTGRSLYCFIPTSSHSLDRSDGSAQVHLVFPTEMSLCFPTACSELANNNEGNH